MIPRANINAWRKMAPWPGSAQVEQDLLLSRALVEMFSRPEVAAILKKYYMGLAQTTEA